MGFEIRIIKPKKVERFPSLEEYRKFTFEKFIRTITRQARTDRALNWMKRFLKAMGAPEKGTWFHRKEVPDFVYAVGCFYEFAKWKQDEISHLASVRGKHGIKAKARKRAAMLKDNKDV